ncbi:MAG: hypothetical protein LBR12_04655, partial [Opitutaceae bacterium]|nr:hypothetical protein [Opitutaceae bacterium]
TGTLTLDASAAINNFRILLSAAPTLTFSSLAIGTTWDLLTADGGIVFTNLSGQTAAEFVASWKAVSYFTASAEALLNRFGDAADLGEFVLKLSADSKTLQLVLASAGLDEYYWNTNTSGSWNEVSNWLDDTGTTATTFPNRPDTDVFFTSNQTPGGGLADLNSGTYTVGEIYIDSGNAADGFRLTNGTLVFDNPKNPLNRSIIEHYDTSGPNDEISANLVLNNDLMILHSAGNSLLISGSITANTSAPSATQNLIIGGDSDTAVIDGNPGAATFLTSPDSDLGPGNLQMDNGALFLAAVDAHLIANQATVSATAAIGGNGTLSANLIMESRDSAIIITGRDGAKWFDTFKLKGDTLAPDGFALYLDADFSNVNISKGATTGGIIGANPTAANPTGNPDGYQLFNMSYASNLFLDGSLFNNQTAEYTININNIGGSISITDWTLHRPLGNREAAGFLLLTVTGDMEQGTWNLLGLNASDGWSLQWMDNAEGHHQLWLFYANPVRIPEPATTALLFGLIVVLFHHKGHKGHHKGHKVPNPLNRR